MQLVGYGPSAHTIGGNRAGRAAAVTVRRFPGAGGCRRLTRARHDGWEITHTTDELPVQPVDVVIGHHYTSTFPTSHFRSGLMVTKHLPGRHVTVTHEALTVRRPGKPTEHRSLREGELPAWLRELQVGPTEEEERRLVARLAELAAAQVPAGAHRTEAR